MTVSERIYIIGGTGNVGKPVVEGLLKAKVPVTVLTRTPDKTLQLYSSLQQDDLLKAVQGGHSDFTAFKESIPGHTRLFLLTPYFGPFDGRKLKTGYAKIAYAAGVKQIVDISATAAGFGWRASFLADLCRQIEEAILAIPNRGAYVALRPTRFMSNNVMYNKHGIVKANAIFEPIGPDELEEWVSPNDISVVATVIFQEPIEKHADPVYKVALGREIAFKQVPHIEKYKILAQFIPHLFAYELAAGYRKINIDPGVLSILLGRQPETLEQWIHANKDAFL